LLPPTCKHPKKSTSKSKAVIKQNTAKTNKED
jgi:hypothetical protein